MGRRKKTLTVEQIEQVERLSAVLKMEDIADFLGISDSTLRRRMNEDPAVLTAYKRGYAKAKARVGTNLLQKALDGNIAAMIFFAKTQMGWKETRQIEANVTNGSLVIDLVNDDDRD